MHSRVLDLSDSSIWKQYFDRLPEALRDVYFMPEYYEIQEKCGMGKAYCFLAENDRGFILYPFLLSEIAANFDLPGKYCDIEGAYGFNGAICSTEDEALCSLFHTSFNDFAQEKNVVAEFTRFNPVLRNQAISTYLTVSLANQNIVLDLSHDNFWLEDYEHSTRKNVNKAMRNGLSVIALKGAEVTDKWLDKFYAIYIDTMVRNNADSFYFFERSFFALIMKNMQANSLLFFTIKEGKPISTEIVLYNKNVAYSYLGGTDSEYFAFRPNDILKHFIILTLKEYGVELYCLGGGIKPGDNLFKYKRSFAKNGIIDFYIGKKVHREDIYKKLVFEWEKRNPGIKDDYSNFLLKYRVQVPR